MALSECVVDYSGGLNYCGTPTYQQTKAYLDGVTFSRDTGNATQAKLTCAVNASAQFGALRWINPNGYIQIGVRCWCNGTNSQGDTISQQGKVDNCGGYTYWLGNRNIDIWSNVNTTNIHTHGGWEFDGSINSPSHAGNGWFGYCDYSLPDDKRITAPQGLSVSWPTPLGKLNGTTSASITGWGKASNMTGTPTNYPYADYRNWIIDLMDKNGNYLAHNCLNLGESKSASWTNPTFYTAEVLSGTANANSTAYTIAKNTAYQMKVSAENSFNVWTISPLSGLLYSEPPTPSVSITSIVYQPSSKDCNLTFSWSKPLDGGALKESAYYSIYDAKGNYYKTNVLLKTNNAGTGSAMSGNITVTGLPPGEQYFVKVTINQYRSDGTTVLDSASKTTNGYAPVANAAFLGFDWDELRRTCTIRAEAPGAANCRIQAGYASNVYNIGNKLTSGQVGTLVVKDLNHGSGQIMYLQAVPEASDGHQYTNEIAKISVPIPNPILGIKTPSCEKIELGAEKEYIVDIIEKKKGSTTCTPRWQNGDRVVVKEPCGGG